jgi:CubicO group peptidase (beta-lactamase class C family)
LSQLLTHTSGLGRSVRGFMDWSDFRGAFGLVCAEPLAHPPGTVCLYSDLNSIVLGEIVQRVSGMRLNDFVAREIYEPLGMSDTGYLPPAGKVSRIAPTTRVGDDFLRGTVHDFKARGMGGVAGHAGVFTTAADLARFARMMLGRGTLEGRRVFKPETIQMMTSVQTPASIPARRGLGWDIDSDYSRPRGQWFPIGSYGMTGFTGVCLWIDPASDTFWFLLSNRVHPDQSGNIGALQRTLGTLAAEAVHRGGAPRKSTGPAQSSAGGRGDPGLAVTPAVQPGRL